MKINLLIAIFILAVSGLSTAQDVKNLNNIEEHAAIQSSVNQFSDNLFYGGEFSASFGTYSQVTIQPSIGYKFNNMFATILKVGYSRGWSSDYKDASGSTLGYDNFGTSLTARFSPVRQFYAMLEPAYYSYQTPVAVITGTKTYYDKQRYNVPFVFLGAGVYQQIGNSRAGITGELKLDLLNDKNSPYKEWTPIYSVGISYGF
ncbi:MAG: hypothetical protein WC139_09180 [Candidatus Kapaibacterium sp.]